jgi:hypothetical protein
LVLKQSFAPQRFITGLPDGVGIFVPKISIWVILECHGMEKCCRIFAHLEYYMGIW